MSIFKLVFVESNSMMMAVKINTFYWVESNNSRTIVHDNELYLQGWGYLKKVRLMNMDKEKEG